MRSAVHGTLPQEGGVQCVCVISGMLGTESQLQIGHQVLLLSCRQLHPAGDKGSIEQLTGGEQEGPTHAKLCPHLVEFINSFNIHKWSKFSKLGL